MSHTLINCTCKNRLGCSLLPFTLIPQYPKRFIKIKNTLKQTKFEDKTVKSSQLSLVLVGLHDFLIFPDCTACGKLGSGKHMFGLSLFRPSRQSNISTSGEERFKYPLPWENRISEIPYPRANKDNSVHCSLPRLRVSLWQIFYSTVRGSLPNLRQEGVFEMSTMVNLGIGFQFKRLVQALNLTRR